MPARAIGPIQQSFHLNRSAGEIVLYNRQDAHDMVRRWESRHLDSAFQPAAATAATAAAASRHPLPKANAVAIARVMRALGPLASPVAARAEAAVAAVVTRKQPTTPPTPAYAYMGEPIDPDVVEDLLQRAHDDRLSPLTLPPTSGPATAQQEATSSESPTRVASYPFKNEESPTRTIFETLVFMSRTPSAQTSPAMESTVPPPAPPRLTSMPSNAAVRLRATRTLCFDLDKEIERRREALDSDCAPQASSTADDNSARASKRRRRESGRQTPPRSLFELLQESSLTEMDGDE
jgi:hypothetical protein